MDRTRYERTTNEVISRFCFQNPLIIKCVKVAPKTKLPQNNALIIMPLHGNNRGPDWFHRWPRH
jgi:hypothetical protein